MGWMDDFGALDYALRASSYSPARGYQTFGSRLKSFGVDTSTSRTGGSSWSDLASGRLATSKPKIQNPTTNTSPLERWDVKYPYSSTGPRSPYGPPQPAAPLSTEGDLIGSIVGSAGSIATNLNLANAIPWFMERVNVAAHDLAKANVPLVSPGAGAFATATDAFIDAVDAVAQPVGQALDAFPTWVRDSQLADRAKLYRALANGEAPDYGPLGPASNPLSTFAQLINLPMALVGTGVERLVPEGPVGDIARFFKQGGLTGAVFGPTVSQQASDAAFWQSEILNAVDPQRKLQAEQRMAILRDSIDLPESVKSQIERKPTATDDEVAKWLNEAPEGKAWSYDPGVGGVVQNMANPMLFYIAEAKAGGEALGMAKATGLGAEIPGIARATGVAARGASLALRIQTAAVASGVAITGVNATMGAIARYVGNDEAVAWFDNANRTTPFSDDPMVQLVTGFSVNPIAAARNLKAGTLGLKHGLVDIPVSKVMGTKLQRYFDSTDVLHDMTRRMFKLGSKEEAAAFLDEQGLREQAPDMILATALDTVLDKLPKEERLAWNAMHSDPAERAAATLKRYGQQALDLIEKQPDLVAARFYNYDWQYRMSTLPFNAEAAAKIARDYRRAVDRTYDIRAEQRAVVGYREHLPPKGQSLARAAVDAAAVDGQVPVKALTDLVVDFPVLRKYVGGTVKSTDTTVPKETIDRIIDDAAAAWAHDAKVNPIKVATGADPVIRPSSPTLMRDYAEAMGTSIDTVNAITEFDGGATHTDLLRRFLVDKGVVDETTAANLAPDEALAKATDYFGTTTRPWREMGARLDGAEKQLDNLRGELARTRRELKGSRELSDRTIRLEKQIKEIEGLVRMAGDPVRPYADIAGEVRTSLPDQHLAEMAARKVDALERLRVLQSVSDDLKAGGLSESDLSRVVMGTDGLPADIYDVLGDPPAAVDAAFLQFKTANMYVEKSLKTEEAAKRGILSSRRQRVRELTNKGQDFVRYHEEAPASYKWAAYADSPGFVKGMRARGDEMFGREVDIEGNVVAEGMSGNQIADMVESASLARGVSGQSMDDIAAAWGVSRGEALRKMAGLREARDSAIEGKTAAALKRTASIKVPDDYVAQAQANVAARNLVYDAEYDAFWHPRNIAKVAEIADRPDELWPALREVAEADPAIMDAVDRVGMAAPEAATAAVRDTLESRVPPPRSTTSFATAEALRADNRARSDLLNTYVDRSVMQRAEAVAKATRGDAQYGQRASVWVEDSAKGYVARADRAGRRDTSAFGTTPAEAVDNLIAHMEAGGDGPAARRAAARSEAIQQGRVGESQAANVAAGVAKGGTAESGGVIRTPRSAATARERVFNDPGLAAAVRKEVVPEGFQPPMEGVIREWTDLDYLITSGDDAGIAAMAEKLAASRGEPAPVQRVSQRVADQLGKMPKLRRSYQYRRALSDADARFTDAPSERILALPENKVGVDVLSVLNHGIPGTKPATLRGVITLLEEIENGNAGRMGIGPELQAEAQRVGRELLDDAVRTAKRSPENVGTFNAGFFHEDEQALARTLDDILSYDQADPLGTLQYGLKKAPKDAVVMEWSKVPGLAEEMLSKRFLPFEERVTTTKTREAFNWVFGKRANETIRLETKVRFIDRAAAKGISPTIATKVWERWSKVAHDSRRPSLRNADGRRTYEAGDNPLYADVWNLPNGILDSTVHGDHTGKGVLYELLDAAEITQQEAKAAESVNFADIFREASSFTRRTLADKVPLGEAIAHAYGMAAHNQVATTAYYWFRFGLDVRYHAMNYLEAQILYAGRAGLKKGEINQGLLGQTEGYLRKMDLDPTSNTGYQFSRDRMAWAYRTFLKEQPDALRRGLRTTAIDDPALMNRALEELARFDPQLRDMIENLDGTPDPTKYLHELDAWHKKMLGNIDEANDGATIDAALAKEMADTPALAEVYDRLGQVNKELWSDIRATFYGNPNRSRAERFLNSYLLFWPLSYQIKSTKWFAKVLYDKVGGVQTNALGAVTLNQMADTHNRLLATDPSYRDWFEKHPTLSFVAQMMFPVSLEGTGVSLNPVLRSIFFDRTKAGMEIGPVYTFNRVIRPLAEELYVDLYPTLGDLPAFDGVYRGLTGRREPDASP